MSTKLDIINAMLAVNGESPVNDENSTNPAAIQASNALDRINKKLQARKWWFNTEIVTLSYTANTGEVIVPQNTLSVDPVDPRSPLVQRGTRLYDKKNNTYVINTSVKVVLCSQLSIDELPHSMFDYLQDKAVKDYYVDDDGDDSKVRELTKREAESFSYLQREHLANSDVNIRRSPLGAQLLRETQSSVRAKSEDGIIY